MIQICIAKITGYGPWTLVIYTTKMLQATLYNGMCKRFF